MNENQRRGVAAGKQGTTFASRHPERLRVVLAGAIAAAMLAVVMLAASAQGGTGGISAGGEREGDRYDRLWSDLSRKNKRWARRTSECESGGDRNIHGGGGRYHGAFQFVLSTWRNAPKSPGGDPHRYRWKTQAVVAVYLKKREGRHHWPVCG